LKVCARCAATQRRSRSCGSSCAKSRRRRPSSVSTSTWRRLASNEARARSRRQAHSIETFQVAALQVRRKGPVLPRMIGRRRAILLASAKDGDKLEGLALQSFFVDRSVSSARMIDGWHARHDEQCPQMSIANWGAQVHQRRTVAKDTRSRSTQILDVTEALGDGHTADRYWMVGGIADFQRHAQER